MLVVWCSLSAAAYVCSTLGMKYWDALPRSLMGSLIVACLLLAVYFEILALRRADMAMTIVLIIGLEAVLALALGGLALGEAYSATKLAGVALVIAGVTVIQTAQPAS